MRKLLFWFSVLFILGHQVLQKGLEITIPWIDSYLDPLLCMPVVLYLWQWDRTYIWGIRKAIGWAEIAGTTIVLSLVFEGFFPLWHSRFYYDPWDILCYGIGAGLYGLASAK